jgi:hypothetical protein
MIQDREARQLPGFAMTTMKFLQHSLKGGPLAIGRKYSLKRR